MGGAIARNLIATGFAISGFDPDKARADAAGSTGVAVKGSAAEAAADADLVLTSLPSTEALDATVDALLAAPRAGPIVAEISTFPLEAKQRAHDRLAAAGIAMLDCPLSGTGAQAVTRDLALYGSGDEAAFKRCRDAFAGFARASHYLGAFGNGSRMKFVANLLVAVHNVAAAEALLLARRAGLDPELTLRAVGDGAGASRMFQVRGPLMVAGDYDEATMRVEVFRKDLDIIASFARIVRSPTPLLAASGVFYEAAMAQGRATQDTACVFAVLERLADST
jgi:3-hydroxyisobutyrate dehydrogenase-like beta-hydroxyacid dehydrogenase